MERMAVDYAGKESLLRVYHSLPAKAALVLSVPFAGMEECLSALEETGFCAMLVASPLHTDAMAGVEAYKGKQGPCHDAGRKATYLGAAIAALDDDNHLLIAGHGSPVCEKTAGVYGFAPYGGLVSLSAPVPELEDRLESDPVIFDCDTFDDDMRALSKMFRGHHPEQHRCLLYYPGPFKFLFLHDGSVVRRGRLNPVPASMKEDLMTKEGFIELKGEAPNPDTSVRPDANTASEQSAESSSEQSAESAFASISKTLLFNDIYEGPGPAWFTSPGFSPGEAAGKDLENNTGITGVKSAAGSDGTHNEATGRSDRVDLSALDDLKTGLKGRLTDVIRSNRKYFILTGSEPDVEGGCCPSDEVAEAATLVRAGILSRYAQPVPEEACPLTTFAFRNEMRVSDDGLQFTIDHAFRKDVLNRLSGKSGFAVRTITKYLLLAFVLASLSIAVLRISDGTSAPSGMSLYEQLVPASQDQFMIVLFHFRERCETCLNMERYTRDVVEAYNKGKSTDDQIRFDLAVINEDSNLNLVRRFNLYTSTLVLVKFEDGREGQVKVLSDAWQLYRDEEAYKIMLSNEIATIIR